MNPVSILTYAFLFFLAIAVILSGALNSGRKLQANYYTEDSDSRRRRLNWAGVSGGIGILCGIAAWLLAVYG